MKNNNILAAHAILMLKWYFTNHYNLKLKIYVITRYNGIY
jgi:hypothetical protein